MSLGPRSPVNYGPGISQHRVPEGGSVSLEAKHTQLNFADSFIELLDNYQSEGHDYLYDIEPQSRNLFWAGYFRQAGMGDAEIKPFYNASFRIRSINIPMPSMEIDMQNELRAPIYKNTNYSHEITIEWFEDVYHSVTKYHLDWYARWYNRQYDMLRCGVNGKFRQMTVVAYHYVNKDIDSLLEIPTIQPMFAFKIGGLMPLKIPDIKFDHNSDQNDAPLSIQYKCSFLQWSYSDRLGLGTHASELFGSSPLGEDYFEPHLDIWTPTGINEESGGQPDSTNVLEKNRLARAMTSYQLSEGAL